MDKLETEQKGKFYSLSQLVQGKRLSGEGGSQTLWKAGKKSLTI